MTNEHDNQPPQDDAFEPENHPSRPNEDAPDTPETPSEPSEPEQQDQPESPSTSEPQEQPDPIPTPEPTSEETTLSEAGMTPKTDLNKRSNDKGEEELGDTRMSFGDHLEELRQRMFRMIFGLLAGFAIGLLISRNLISFIAQPLLAALATSGMDAHLFTSNLPEAFLTYLRVALYAGIFISSPYLFNQLWGFIAAGLYPKERRYVEVFAPFAAGLFIIGGLFFLLVVAPISCNFFVKFSSSFARGDFGQSHFFRMLGEAAQPGTDPCALADPCAVDPCAVVEPPAPTAPPPPTPPLIRPLFTVQSYVSLISVLTLSFGIAFQMPLAVLLLGRVGLVSIAQLCKVRPYVLLGVVTLSAIMTPPDVFSQIALSVPMYGLYELGILLLRFWPDKKK